MTIDNECYWFGVNKKPPKLGQFFFNHNGDEGYSVSKKIIGIILGIKATSDGHMFNKETRLIITVLLMKNNSLKEYLIAYKKL